jgi:hypothetical protein
MTWHTNWAWGLPLIVLNVVIHVPGIEAPTIFSSGEKPR